jgi:hypothetical protein
VWHKYLNFLGERHHLISYERAEHTQKFLMRMLSAHKFMMRMLRARMSSLCIYSACFWNFYSHAEHRRKELMRLAQQPHTFLTCMLCALGYNEFDFF